MTSSSASFTLQAFLRREVKYALPNADAGKFRSILDVNCRRVNYGRPTSRVCSIYFDDSALSSCYANLDGTARRSKTRIRWYDEPFPKHGLFFEVKKREDYGIKKERLPIRTEEPLETMAFHDIISELAELLPDHLRELLMARAEPKVMIEYERAYYVALDGSVRVTLDRDLVFWSQEGKIYPSRRFPVRLPGLTILEAKTQMGQEEDVRRLLLPLDPWVTRSSKYVLACQHLGFV